MPFYVSLRMRTWVVQRLLQEACWRNNGKRFA